MINVNDRRPAADSGMAPSAADPADPADPATDNAEAMPGSGSDRRAFLRQLSGDAVSTAGRLAGFSSILRRSVVAVGATVTRGLEASADEGEASNPSADSAVPGVEPGLAPVTGPLPSSAVGMLPPPDPLLGLTRAQHDFLTRAQRCTLAVNDPAGPPHLTSSMVHWDGSAMLLPGQLFTARATNIDRDPHVSLLVDDANSEAWVAITGVASIVHGDEAAELTRLILATFLPEGEAARRWAEMAVSGDRIVIRVRPTRLVWRPA